MDHIALSKEISYALRHAPQEYGLTLDEDGWVSIDALLFALKKDPRFSSVNTDDLHRMIQQSEKKRHEIRNQKIRALYGHSIAKKIQKPSVQPPDILYHGTTRRFANQICTHGLISKNRQYVHLSVDPQTALQVGRRRDDSPVLFQVDAKQAWDGGILFYIGNENIWLADQIPPKYVRKMDAKTIVDFCKGENI